MRKTLSAIISIFIVMCAVLMLPVSAAEGDPIGKVVVHYQNWENEYAADAGVATWATGSTTARYVKEAEEDFFGAVVEVPIYAGAEDTVGIIYLVSGAGTADDWSSKGTLDMMVDVTEIKSGAKTQIDIYAFYSGVGNNPDGGKDAEGKQNFFVADPTKVNVLIAYFDANESYEDKLGVHSWGGWDEASQNDSWGNPLGIFVDAFYTLESKQGKVGMLQATVSEETNKAANAGFLVYAGDDATKKHGAFDGTGNTGTGDAGNFYVANEAEAGTVVVCYVGGGTGYVKRSDVDTEENTNMNVTYALNSFAFKFIDYTVKAGVASGTYASRPDSLLVTLSTDIELTYEAVEGKKTVQELDYKKPIFADDATPFVQSTVTQTLGAYTPTALPATAIGRVVVHFQKWDGNYNQLGMWNWNTGAAAHPSLGAVGLDDFGAVFELNMYAGYTTDSGFKVTNHEAGLTDWGSGITEYTSDVKPLSGTDYFAEATTAAPVTIHVYLYQGGGSSDGASGYFVSDPTKANVMVIYYALDGAYEDNLGFHTWGTGLPSTDWGNPVLRLSAIGKSPVASDMIIKGSMISNESFDGRGFLLYGPEATLGDDGKYTVGEEGKKTPNDVCTYITDLATLAPGDVRVVYVCNNVAYYGDNAKARFAEASFSGTITGYEDVMKDVEVDNVVTKFYTAEELLARFGLTKNGVAATIDSIQYDETATVAKEFVLIFEGANLLDNKAEYVLSYTYTPAGAEESSTISIDVDVDSENPEIEILSESETITINQGTAWDQTLFPVYRASDDRDGIITRKVYVAEGEGNLDPNVPGDYKITLTVEDVWGNVGTKDFTITVVEVSNCQNSSGMLVSLSLLGLALFFIRRRKTL